MSNPSGSTPEHTARVKPRSSGTPSDKHATARLIKEKYTRRRTAIDNFVKRVQANGGVADDADKDRLRELGLREDEIEYIVKEAKA